MVPGSEIRDPGSEIRDPGSEIRDPGSGKNLFRIPDPGVEKHPIPDPGSGSATLSKRNLQKKFSFLAGSESSDPYQNVKDPEYRTGVVAQITVFSWLVLKGRIRIQN